MFILSLIHASEIAAYQDCYPHASIDAQLHVSIWLERVVVVFAEYTCTIRHT